MSKMSTELVRVAWNGPTIGTRWSALFFARPDFDAAPIRAALQAAVVGVDAQMSTWKPDSDLMRINAARSANGCRCPRDCLRCCASASKSAAHRTGPLMSAWATR